MAIDHSKLESWFANKPGDNSTTVEIKQCALRLAKAILQGTPACADQSHAIRCVRESVIWSNESKTQS